MATSTEQINDLIAGYTDLKTYFEGARNRIEAAIDTMYDPKTLYVDSNAGDDANEGTSAAPVRTFGKALTLVPDGGKSIIRLREGLVYGTSGGDAALYFNASTVVEVNRWDSDWADTVTHPIIHLENAVSNGQNSSACTIYAGGPFQFIFRGVKVVADVPANEVLGWVAHKRKFIRTASFVAGTQIGLQLHNAHFTLLGNAVEVAGPQYREAIFVGIDHSSIAGGGALITDAADGSCMVSVGSLTASDGSKILDGGTIGQNVLTNSPTVTL